MNKVKNIPIELWEADAVVLFGWLRSMKLEGATSVLVNKAQKQALTDLFSRFEESSISEATQKDIEKAEYEVSKNMGWS